jgi:rhamnosyltransferase
MNIASVVILYKPAQDIIDNILSYSSFVQTIYVIDNTEVQDKLITGQINQLSHCVILHDAENRGIAERLNQAARLAKNAGFSWLLTMDQDSSFPAEAIKAYINCIDSYSSKESVAVFGVQFDLSVLQSRNCHAEETSRLITSGSVVNLDLFSVTGGFHEPLFIDEVDTEYCYRSILSGYRIICFRNIFLQHQLGILSEHRSLKDFKTSRRSLHSPLRLYYMTRNFLYIHSKYRDHFYKDITTGKKILINNIKNNVLYNRHRLSVIIFVFRGILDFKRSRMGKYGATQK